MKRIVLCADDYGQAPAISEGIRNLVAVRRLSATSCMVNTRYWQEEAAKLLPWRDQIDIGLHFNLTEGQPLASEFRQAYGEDFPGLGWLLRRSHLLQLDQQVIAAELNAQIDAFIDAMGCLPNYIDGHQHVHHFPVIRKALLSVYQDRLKDTQPYIRLVAMRLRWADMVGKKAVIYATGVPQLRRLLQKQAIPHNNSFAGVYDFKDAESYPAYFRAFLGEIGAGGVMMCHPGLAAADQLDEINAARVCEYNYLIGQQFEQDLLAQGIVLSRFSSAQMV